MAHAIGSLPNFTTLLPVKLTEILILGISIKRAEKIKIAH